MRQIPKHQTFKFKITALLVLMVMIATIAVGGSSLFVAENEMRQVIARQEMSTLASAAAYIDRDLTSKQQMLHLLAESLQASPVAHDKVQHQLEARGTLRDEFFNVSAFDVEGNVIANLQDRRMIGRLNVADRPHFRATLAAHESVISAPFRSMLTGRPVVVVTQPVLDAGGNIDYVLTASIDLTRPAFAGQLNALRGNAEGYLFIVTADGTMVHHPDRHRLLMRDDQDSSMTRTVLSEADGWRDDIFDGKQQVLLAHTRLHKVDWTIAAVFPVRDMFAAMTGVRLRALAAATILGLLAGLLGWLIVRNLLLPLYTLYEQVKSLGRNDADIEQFNTTAPDEFGLLSRAFYKVARQSQLAERNLQRMATTDALTGAHNRRMFDEFFPQALRRAVRTGRQIGLAVLDIDHFKFINDTFGHPAGDAVLVEFSHRLRAAVRSTDTVARIAGDEFVIVFEHLDAGQDVNVLGQKIIAAMQEPFMIAGQPRQVTTSIGIALTTDLPCDETKVMLAADQALYCVKAAGRNGFLVNFVGAERMLAVRDFGTPAPRVNYAQNV